MDQVIVNWDQAFIDLTGLHARNYADMYGHDKRYDIVYQNSPQFYENMSWMEDGRYLYNFVKDLNTELLSHAERHEGDDNRVFNGKIEWLKKHGVTLKPNIVSNRDDKAKFATENAILIDDRKDNCDEFVQAGGNAILHTSAHDTIDQLKSKLNIPEIHRLYNSILEPTLWDEDKKLDPDVSAKLKTIATTFYENTELKAPIDDIVILGSITGYNWTPTSDIDLHIIIDFKKIDENVELVKNYVDTLKGIWNSKHDIRIKSHPVEVYIQDINEENKSKASYSVLKTKWLKKPVYKEPDIDKELIKKKYKTLSDKIDSLVANPSIDGLNDLLQNIYDMRQEGLDRSGEYSVENLVFKLLRKTGYLDKMRNAVTALTDSELNSAE